MLVKTADILAVSLDEWVGRQAKISEPSIRNAELQQRVHEVDQRPGREQQAVIRLHGCRWYETMDGRR